MSAIIIMDPMIHMLKLLSQILYQILFKGGYVKYGLFYFFLCVPNYESIWTYLEYFLLRKKTDSAGVIGKSL